jgi:hypothetical protein
MEKKLNTIEMTFENFCLTMSLRDLWSYIVEDEDSDDNDDDCNLYHASLFLTRFIAKQMKGKMFTSTKTSLRQNEFEGSFEAM